MRIRESRCKEKDRKDIFSSESAAATVIAAVLLLSIIFTIFAVVRIAYVPEWKNDAEQLHMSEIQRDMTELKSTADMITLLQSTNSNSSPNNFPFIIPPVTVPISMGGGEIPILEPSKSSGTLSVNTEPCKMTITLNNSSNSSFFSKTVDCGGITYYSNNRQYVDQIFRYENGALILKQGERSLMKQDPSFIITSDKTNDNCNISIQAINIKGYSDTISSDTDSSLRLNGTKVETIYSSSSGGEDIKSLNCMITTKYPEAWMSYLSKIARKAGLANQTDYTLESTSDNVCFNFIGSKNLENLYISESVIGAELGVESNLNYNSFGTSHEGKYSNSSDTPYSVPFSDPSENNATAWNWSLGDGDTSDQQNPMHNYSRPGNHTVNLTVSYTNGTNSTATITTVNVPQPKTPVANFTNSIIQSSTPLLV
jgi:hypothetical protein